MVQLNKDLPPVQAAQAGPPRRATVALEAGRYAAADYVTLLGPHYRGSALALQVQPNTHLQLELGPVGYAAGPAPRTELPAPTLAARAGLPGRVAEAAIYVVAVLLGATLVLVHSLGVATHLVARPELAPGPLGMRLGGAQLKLTQALRVAIMPGLKQDVRAVTLAADGQLHLQGSARLLGVPLPFSLLGVGQAIDAAHDAWRARLLATPGVQGLARYLPQDGLAPRLELDLGVALAGLLGGPAPFIARPEGVYLHVPAGTFGLQEGINLHLGGADIDVSVGAGKHLPHAHRVQVTGRLDAHVGVGSHSTAMALDADAAIEVDPSLPEGFRQPFSAFMSLGGQAHGAEGAGAPLPRVRLDARSNGASVQAMARVDAAVGGTPGLPAWLSSLGVQGLEPGSLIGGLMAATERTGAFWQADVEALGALLPSGSRFAAEEAPAPAPARPAPSPAEPQASVDTASDAGSDGADSQATLVEDLAPEEATAKAAG